MELNYTNVVVALKTAAGVQHGPDQVAAEAQLKQWEIMKGYHFLLQKVYGDMSQPLQVRWLAVICLKNGVDRYWRPTRMHAICKEEKQAIRQNLFAQVDESNTQLTIQNAHTVARICRHDFPSEWPTVFDEVADILESQQLSESLAMVRINNILIILNQILKILSSVRIGRARTAMQGKMPIIVPHIIKFYHHYFHMWVADGGSSQNTMRVPQFDAATMQVDYMCLKNLRRAIVDGYEYPQRSRSICEFLETSLAHFQKLLVLHENAQIDQMEKFLKCYMKLYLGMVSENTSGFLLVPAAKSIILTLLSMLQQKASAVYELEERDGTDFWEQMAVKAILILKKITAFGYRRGTILLRRKSDNDDMAKAVSIVRNQILTDSVVQNLADLLISSYMKLRPCDLEAWQQEPEQWVTEQRQASWEFQILQCAQNYFQDLVTYFKALLAPFIMKKISETMSGANADFLDRDAVMAAFQLSSVTIADQCDFDHMFSHFFLPVASAAPAESAPIIRRRLCLIICDWVSVKCTRETRLQIYELLANLLDPSSSNELVVKLTACETLRHMLEDWEFRRADFKEFLDSTIEGLISLLHLLHTTESKMFLLKILALCIERNESCVSDHALYDVTSIVPRMWQDSNSANEMILKNALLRLLKSLVNSLNTRSPTLYPLIMPLIPACCTETAQYYSLLCEDGFELWAVTLKQLPLNADVPQEMYNDWFPLVIKGLCNWTEILPLVLKIVRSYSLINPLLFESDYGAEIFKILAGYLPTMRDDSVFITSQIIEILMLQKGVQPISLGNDVLISNLVGSELFHAMITYIIQDTETPNCEIKMAIPVLRMATMDPEFFIFQLLRSCLTKQTPLAVLFRRFISKLLEYLKMTYDSKARKLFLLALLSFYDPKFFTKRIPLDPSVHGDVDYQLAQMSDNDGVALVLTANFNRILSLTARFLEEVNENSQGDCKAYHHQGPYDDEELVLAQTDEEKREEGEDPDNGYAQEFRVPDSGEKLRYTKLKIGSDPLYNVNLKLFVKTRVNQLVGSVENYEGLINSLSKETLDDLQLEYSR